MSRVAHECRSARIISFPAASTPPLHPARTGTRWVAAAVAAGVILGIVGEHVTHRITRTPYQGRSFQEPESQLAIQPVRAVTVRTVSSSDDEFYGQVELAFGSAAPATLRSLDALTPRASDVRDNRETCCRARSSSARVSIASAKSRTSSPPRGHSELSPASSRTASATETGRLTVHLAREFGFCYGVDRAVTTLRRARVFPIARCS
jgi:hypothetical protein